METFKLEDVVKSTEDIVPLDRVVKSAEKQQEEFPLDKVVKDTTSVKARVRKAVEEYTPIGQVHKFVFGKEPPSIAQRAEDFSKRTADAASPLVPGAPVRESAVREERRKQVNFERLGNTPEEGIQSRITQAVGQDKEFKQAQQNVDTAFVQTRPEPTLPAAEVLRQGVKKTVRAAKGAVAVYTGDREQQRNLADADRNAPQSADITAMLQDAQSRLGPAGDDAGWLDTAKAVGDAMVANPAAASKFVLEQTPNALIPLASGAVGFAVAGPLGGVAGLFGGNIGLETGFRALEKFEQETQRETVEKGAIKGAVIGAVDTASIVAGGYILNAGKRAVESATRKALLNAGVARTPEAISAAMLNPGIRRQVQTAQLAALTASENFFRRTGQAGLATAVDAFGEGLGEYLGSLAADGEASKMEAVLEAFSGLGASVAQTGLISAYQQAQSLDNAKAVDTVETLKEEALEFETIPEISDTESLLEPMEASPELTPEESVIAEKQENNLDLDLALIPDDSEAVGELGDIDTRIQDSQGVTNSPITPEAAEQYQKDIEAGMSEEVALRRLVEVVPNRVPFSQRPIGWSTMPEQVGLSLSKVKVPLNGTVVVAGHTNSDYYSATYTEALGSTLHQWQSEFLPVDERIIVNLGELEGSAVGSYAQLESGLHVITPREIPRGELTEQNINGAVRLEPLPENKRGFNSFTQQQTFGALTHEFGHTIIASRFAERMPEGFRNIVGQLDAGKVMSEEVLSTFPQEEAALIRDYQEQKARILSGEMPATEFSDTWLGIWKLGKDILKTKTQKSLRSYAQGVLDEDRKLLGEQRIPLEQATALELIHAMGRQTEVMLKGTIVGNTKITKLQPVPQQIVKSNKDAELYYTQFSEFMAEQFTRYAHEQHIERGTALGAYFERSLQALRAFFKKMKGEKIIAPGTTFKDWMEKIREPRVLRKFDREMARRKEQERVKQERIALLDEESVGKVELAKAQKQVTVEKVNFLTKKAITALEALYSSDSFKQSDLRTQRNRLNEAYSSLTVPMLKQVAEHFRVNYNKGDSKETLKDKIEKSLAVYGVQGNALERSKAAKPATPKKKSPAARPQTPKEFLDLFESVINEVKAEEQSTKTSAPKRNRKKAAAANLELGADVILRAAEVIPDTTDPTREKIDDLIAQERYVEADEMLTEYIMRTLKFDKDAAKSETQKRSILYTDQGSTESKIVVDTLNKIGMREHASLWQKAVDWTKDATHYVLQVQQLAHSSSDTGTRIFAKAQMQLQALKNNLLKTPTEVAERWENLPERDYLLLNDLLFEEYNVGEHKTALIQDPGSGKWSHEAGQKFIEYLESKGIDIESAQGGKLARLYLDVKNTFLQHIQTAENIALRIARSKYAKTPLVARKKEAEIRKLATRWRQEPFLPQGSYGEYVVKVYADVGGERHLVYRTHFESAADQDVMVKKLQAQRIPADLISWEKIDGGTGPQLILPTEFLTTLGDSGEFTSGQLDIIKDHMIPLRGEKFFSKFTRDAVKIAGTSHDQLRNYANWIEDSANFLAKLEYGRKMTAARAVTRADMADLKLQGNVEKAREKQKLLDTMTRTQEFVMHPQDEFFKTRSTIALSYLMYAPKTALMNLSGLMQTWAAVTADYGDIQGNAILAKTMKDLVAGNLTMDEKLVQSMALNDGIIDQGFGYFMSGLANAGTWARRLRPTLAGKGARMFVDVGMWPFKAVEIVNRQMTLLSVYRAERGILLKQGMDGHSAMKQAYETASEYTRLLQNDYSSGNRPEILRGKVKSLLTIFVSYPQYMSWIMLGGFERGSKARQRALGRDVRSWATGSTARLWLLFLLMTGTEGVLFGEFITSLIQRIYKQLGGQENIRLEQQKFMKEVLGMESAYWRRVVQRGFLHDVLGVDLSGSLSLGAPFPGMRLIDPHAKNWQEFVGEAFGELSGPFGGTSKGPIALALDDDITAGDVGRAIPGFIGNTAKAIEAAERGVRNNQRANLLRDENGNVRQPTKTEIVLIASGFRLAEVARSQELRAFQQERRLYWQGRRTGLKQLYRRGAEDRNNELMQQVLKDVDKYNSEIPHGSLHLPRKELYQFVRTSKRAVLKIENEVHPQRDRALFREVKDILN